MPGRPASSHFCGSSRSLRCSMCINPSIAKRAATLRVSSILQRHESPSNNRRGTSEGQHVFSAPRARTISIMVASIFASDDDSPSSLRFLGFASSIFIGASPKVCSDVVAKHGHPAQIERLHPSII